MADRYRVVLVTAPNKKEATQLAKGLVRQKLAACVNVVPGVESHYWWENKLERAEELLLIIKTRAGLIRDLTTYVKEHHSYKVPEVLSLEVSDGNPDYLDWVGANTTFTRAEEEADRKRS